MARIVARFGLTRFEADEFYRQALDYFSKNKLEQALIHMGYAIEALPSHAEYYAARGFMFLEDGVQEKAEEDFERALKLNAYEMLANYGRGIIAYRDKNWDEALAYFADAWAAQPQRPETLYYMALVYHRLGDNGLARAYMDRARHFFEQSAEKQHERAAKDAQRWVEQFDTLLREEQEREDGPRINPHPG